MTQEEITKAAEAYTDATRAYMFGYETELVMNAFEAGAEWALANQWHDINKELPRETENVLVLSECQIPIIGKMDSEIIKELNITYWCEIPKFNEKGDER